MIRLTFGSVIAMAVLVAVCAVAALNWMGKNAASIRDGVGTLLLVIVVLAVTAAAVVLARAYWQSRRPAVPAEPPPARPPGVTAAIPPRRLAAVPDPPALEAPRAYLTAAHLEQLAAIMRHAEEE